MLAELLLLLFDGGVNGRKPSFDLFSVLFCGEGEGLPPVVFALLEFEFGGVNGRKPPFDLSCGVGEDVPAVRLALLELAGVNGRLPGVDGPRASFGDMVGA